MILETLNEPSPTTSQWLSGVLAFQLEAITISVTLARVEPGLRNELLELGVVHRQMRQHVLTEERALGLRHLESGDHLGVRHHHLQQGRIGGGESAQGQREEYGKGAELCHENLSADITRVAWGKFPPAHRGKFPPANAGRTFRDWQGARRRLWRCLRDWGLAVVSERLEPLRNGPRYQRPSIRTNNFKLPHDAFAIDVQEDRHRDSVIVKIQCFHW